MEKDRATTWHSKSSKADSKAARGQSIDPLVVIVDERELVDDCSLNHFRKANQVPVPRGETLKWPDQQSLPRMVRLLRLPPLTQSQ